MSHEISVISAARKRKRTVFYGYCTCGAGTTNSVNGESARKKLRAHAAGDDRGMFKRSTPEEVGSGDVAGTNPGSAASPVPTDEGGSRVTDRTDPEQEAAEIAAELAADATRTRADAEEEKAPRGFDPACLFLLDLHYANLFSRASARAGEDQRWSCKGCGATVPLGKREAHFKAHKRTRDRGSKGGNTNMADTTKTEQQGPTLREQYVAAAKERWPKIKTTVKTGYTRIELDGVNLGFVNGKTKLVVDILGGRTGTSAKVKISKTSEFKKGLDAMQKHYDASIAQRSASNGGKATSGKAGGKATGSKEPAAPLAEELTDQAVAVAASQGDQTAAAELRGRDKTTVGEITKVPPVQVEPDPKPETPKKGRGRKASAKSDAGTASISALLP